MSLFFKKKLLSKNEKKILLAIILFSLIHNFIIFPAQAAESDSLYTNSQEKVVSEYIIKAPSSEIKIIEQLKNDNDNLPKVVQDFKVEQNTEKTTVKYMKTVSMTAYNSEKGQTDNDPCTTANGFNVCKHGIEDTVAANFLPFGTKIQIPELFGDKVFVVRDRMNRRYSNRVDVWFLEREDALKFGVRKAKIVVLNS